MGSMPKTINILAAIKKKKKVLRHSEAKITEIWKLKEERMIVSR